MRVYEVAEEFGVSTEQVVQLFRTMGISSARSQGSKVEDSTVAKLRARFERERRAGHEESEEIVEAIVGGAKKSTGRRRRRRKKRRKKAPAEAAAPAASAGAAADAAESMAAEAADEAAERGAELVTSGGEEPKDVTAVVESPGPGAPESGPPTEAPEAEEAAEQAEEPVAEAEEPEPEARADEAEDVEAATEAEEAEEAPEAPEPEEAQEAEQAAEPEPEEPAPERKEKKKKKKKRRRRPRRVADSLPGLAPAASAGPGGKVRIQKDDRKKKRGKKKRRKRRERPDKESVQDNVQRTLAEMKSSGTSKKRRRSRSRAANRQAEEAERERQAAEQAQTVRVNEFLTVAELAELIDESSTEIIQSAFKNLGLMVTINQRLDFDQIELLLDEFGYRTVREQDYGVELDEETEAEDRPEDLAPRPPVVTIMGHVDHGKTLLLDHIRKTNVVAGEAGGITQHMGAYHVTLDDGRQISFLDTPGHAAFTAMRSRGAEVTDLVILVIAADDAVMPQTIEAISHAKNAGVPVIVAINKMDLPQADATSVKQNLLEHEVVVEEFGGDVLVSEVSAKTGEGVDDLLENVLLQSELLQLRANPDRPAQGTVIESQLDIGKGPLATVLVTNGTLRVGDDFVCGLYEGRARALLDERGHDVDEAGPGVPVQVLGSSGVPQAGDVLVATDAERATDIAQTRQRLDREKKLRVKGGGGVKLTDISKMLAEGETSQLNVVIKGDVNGSVQALSDSLEQLSNDEVEVEVIHRGVGAINESDVLLAATSGAIIIGFHVRPDSNARSVAEREGVDIRQYDIIYEAVQDVTAALEGMLAPEEREVLLGVAEIRQLFKVPRVGTVAGCYVTEGVIDRNGHVRVVRDGVELYDGELGSLKRFKDDVGEVREGFECGLNVENYDDVKVGDQVECYRIEEVARTLAAAGGEEA